MSSVQDQVNSAVESAREKAEKIGESVSELLQGNPFNTIVGKKIEQATDASELATENWGLNMEIVDFINNTEEGGREAIRAIRKRLLTQVSKNNSIVMYTLTVLETCVKNGDHRFHVLVCNKDFVLLLVRLIGPKFDAPRVIQERVLSLIQAWADAFRSDPDLQGVQQVYEDLKQKGVEFPETDLDSLAPIITPKRTIFKQPSPATSNPTPPPRRTRNPVQPVPAAGEAVVPLDSDTDQMSKLRKDIDLVNSNLKVFREMLTQITASGADQDELQLLQELCATSKAMQERILQLIRTVANEQVTFELLVLNDEFNSVFEKYERWLANSAGESAPEATGAAKFQEGDLINLGGEESLEKQLSNAKLSQEATPSAESVYAANSEKQAEIGLKAATAQRTEDAAPATEAEASEMAEWIAKSEEQKKAAAENDKL